MDDIRGLFLGEPRQPPALPAIGDQLLPGAILQPFPQRFLGEFIDGLPLSRSFRLQLRQQFVRYMDAVLGCHTASPLSVSYRLSVGDLVTWQSAPLIN